MGPTAPRLTIAILLSGAALLAGCGSSSPQVAAATSTTSTAPTSTIQTTSSRLSGSPNPKRHKAAGTKSLPVPGPDAPVTAYDPAQRLRSVIRHLPKGKLRALIRRTQRFDQALRSCHKAGDIFGSRLLRCLQRHGVYKPA